MSGAALVIAAAEADLGPGGRIELTGRGHLPSAFDVGGLATGAVGTAASQLARLTALHGRGPAVTVDRGLACAWFDMTIRPQGWSLPPAWDELAGIYPVSDGWIRLHTNVPHHKTALFRALGGAMPRDALERKLAGMPGAEIEAAVIGAGGCAAELLSEPGWAAGPQGRAIAAEPLIALDRAPGPPPRFAPRPGAPLSGLRVLDLTRVLAGPVCRRLLAALGADILRIDPPGWDEPGVVPEVAVGKTCARLDLHARADRAVFERLLPNADVIVHGYRNGAMEALGYDTTTLRLLSPGIVETTLSAYGHTGPWSGRRGFDSLVQMSTGLAHTGMRAKTSPTAGAANRPLPLPVQALDHATGYLMAAATLAGLARRMERGQTLTARLSLAKVADLLKSLPRSDAHDFGETVVPETLAPGIEQTA